jgi:hypothetical protein
MIYFILFYLATFGMAMTVTKSRLFTRLQNAFQKDSFWWVLFNCPWCFGTWSGFLVRFLMMIWLRYPEIHFVWVDLIDVFLFGISGGIVTFFGYLFYLKLNGNKA